MAAEALANELWDEPKDDDADLGVWYQLQAELDHLDTQLQTLVSSVAPTLVALPGVGIETAGQLLVTAGDNPSGSARRPPSPTCAAPPHPRVLRPHRPPPAESRR